MANGKEEESMAAAPSKEYALKGPQVEPEASYWNRCPRPCPVSLEELVKLTDREKESDGKPNRYYLPPHPTDAKTLDDELDELEELARLLDDPTQVVSTAQNRERLPISLFLQLRPVPLGAVVNSARGDAFPVILTGRELARYFENETPGLAHRHALNFLLRDTNWSPPRQALVWTALDVAIYSAMCAAWYYKWLSPRPNISRRPRPIEVRKLDVLYDRPVNSTGSGDAPGVRPMPMPSPGTPRHPAYPSGHSTYAGAASELLSFFFPDYRRDLDSLADNAGVARLWAGIHWRSDHEAGVQLGRAVACLVIDQLRRIGIPMLPPMRPKNEMPPSRKDLEKQAKDFEKNCGKAVPSQAPGLYPPVSIPCVRPGEGEAKAGAEPSRKRGESFVG